MSSLFRVGERIVDQNGGMTPQFQRSLVELLSAVSGGGSRVVNTTVSSAAIVAPISSPAAPAALFASAAPDQTSVIFAE